MPMIHQIIASAPKRATPEPLRLTKAAIAICAALIPVFCFGSFKVRIKYFQNVGSTNVVYSALQGLSDIEAVHDVYFAHRFGICIGQNSIIQSPSVGNSTSWWNAILNNQINSTGSGNSYTNSPADFPRVFSLYNVASSLISNGYDGPGVNLYATIGTRYMYNVYFPDIVANVFASTNSIYRQIVLSHLQEMRSTLSFIGQHVDTINNDYRFVNDPYLNPSYSNIAARAAYYNGLGGNGLFLESYLPNHPEQAPEIAKAVLENARKNVGYILNACRDPESPFYGHSLLDVLDSPEDFEKAISAGGGGSVVSQFANDVERARQAGENFNNSVNNRLDEITSSLVGSQGSDAPSIMGLLGGGSDGGGGIAGDIRRLSTNNWAAAVTNQLAENTQNIKDELANMFGPATNNVQQIADDIHDNIELNKNFNERAAEAAENIDQKLGDTLHVQIDGINVGFTLEDPTITIDNTQFDGVSVPIGNISQRLQDWMYEWEDWHSYDDSARHWANFYDMVARIETSITNLVSTNDFQRYYFDRFKQADKFIDKDEQSFKIDDACDLIFGNGFDIGEYSKLNWFSRMEVLLYKVNSVTNVLETTDISSITNEVNTLNLNVTNFVNASVKVVGVFKLIDGFAKSMRSAFGGYSSPQTSGVVLLEEGHWIGGEALVLRVPVEVQNALRLVFECIWYLSSFVIGWRILVWSWDKIVSLMRWLWSLIDI